MNNSLPMRTDVKYNERMTLPNRKAHQIEPTDSAAYMRELMEKINMSQIWVADQTGISRRRIQYLLVGSKNVNGQAEPVAMTYPEQFCLEQLADAGQVFNPASV